ncbi:MAG: MdtA/MuxA family multidrug efflux RND transporter periplasmic adaptor subunit [Holophaga sp.]|nr:MdtA/MuxA family multidrug efflux RND transporter periplasmic adaptor subunit [Holophaga sp.]
MKTDVSQNSPAQEPLGHRAEDKTTPWWRTRSALTAGALVILATVGIRTLGCAAKPKAPAARAIPIKVAKATRGDMPVTLTGLGTVTALNTVTIKTRVDGQLIRIAFQEGQFVRQGDLLAEIDPRPFQVQLMQAEGQMAKDQAAFKNASADLQRLQTLVQQGIISRQQLDTQMTTVAQFEASLKADQAQVESAKLNLVYSRITAPIAGKIGLRSVDPGNMVRASDPNGLAIIAPVQPITVLFTIPADRIQQVLTQNQKGKKLSVEAFDRDMKTRLAVGEVLAIDNQVDPSTGTIRIKAIFSNADLTLFPNQFVNARLRIDTLVGLTLIPSVAIQQSPQGPFVYLVKPDSTVEMRTVVIEASEGDISAIRTGLVAGEIIAIDGLEKLRPGAKVDLPPTDGQEMKKAK